MDEEPSLVWLAYAMIGAVVLGLVLASLAVSERLRER